MLLRERPERRVRAVKLALLMLPPQKRVKERRREWSLSVAGALIVIRSLL